jgi:hypothetical protein
MLRTPNHQFSIFAWGDEEHGDLLIQGFWEQGIDIITNVYVTNMHNKSYWSKHPHRVLAQHEKEKRCKYLASCTTVT